MRLKMNMLLLVTEEQRRKNREWYLKNHEKLKEKNKIYRQTHPEWKKNYDKKYRETHKEEIKNYLKNYYRLHHAEQLKKRQEYRQKNREEINKQKMEKYWNTHSPFVSKYEKLGITKREYKALVDKKYREKNKEKIQKKRKEYYQKNKEKWQKNNQFLIKYKGNKVKVDREPRIGKCSFCGKKGKTNMHHEKYDDTDPLANTIELCVKCHSNIHKFGKRR